MKAFVLLVIGFALIYGGISGKLASTFVPKKTAQNTNYNTPPVLPPETET